jgi:hypothetical protein
MFSPGKVLVRDDYLLNEVQSYTKIILKDMCHTNFNYVTLPNLSAPSTRINVSQTY